MKGKRKFRYSHGKALAPEVALNAAVLRALVREHYENVCGGKCDLCPATKNLRLVRRDGEPRDPSIFGLKEIINAGTVVGDQLSLPSTYTLRCRACVGRVAVERKRMREVKSRAVLNKHGQWAREVIEGTVPVSQANGESGSVRIEVSGSETCDVRYHWFDFRIADVDPVYDLSQVYRTRSQPPRTGWCVTFENGERLRFREGARVAA